MISLLLVTLGIVVGYLTAYVISLYSLAVNLDPEEVDSLAPRLSGVWHGFLKRLSDNPRAFLQIAVVYNSAALVLITIASLHLMKAVVDWSGVSSYIVVPIGLILVWLLFLVFVEMLPRRSSRQALDEGIVYHLWIVATIYFLFLPVVRAYGLAMQRSKDDETVTEEEKEDLVERAIETLADQAGIGETIVEDDEKEMIGQIFLLDQTTVREIMVPRIDCTAIDQTMSFSDIRKLITRDGHSRYPVYEGSIDKVVGLLYVKDLFNRMPRPGEEFNIADYLRKPFFVPETKVIGQLLREFKERSQHIAIVVDEYGGVAGLVSLEDIIEEIFGEIRDEHDAGEQEELVPLADDRYLVSAGLLVEKMQDIFDTEYEQGDFDTVGGLIYDLVGSVPGQGQILKWHDLQFEVVAVEGQRITQVKVGRVVDGGE